MTKKLEPRIIFEDTHLVVLSKPAGLLSQGEKTGDDNLVDWLRGHFGRNYVGLVHRLDRNTSGIMVVAKRSKSATRLTDALQSGHLHRSYLAWAHGTLSETAKWKHRLLKDRAKNTVQVVSPNHPQGSDASLTAHPVAYGRWNGFPLTLIQYVLETGRSHQIRVQSSKERFPILGDPKYGNPGSRDFGRPALHSFLIQFPHPMTEELMKFEDPLPLDMEAIARSETPV